MHGELPRRRFMQVVGAASAGAALAGTAGATPGVSTEVLDSQFEDAGLQESLIVFDDAESATRLDTLDLEEPYHVFEHVEIAWTHLDPDQLETVAGWDSVRRVKKAEELEWYNDSTSRKSMAVDVVHEGLGDLEKSYKGATEGDEGELDRMHFAIIDSGINGSHPGIDGRVEANYRWVDEPTGPRDPFWVDVGQGDTDELGHGMHCTGIAAGDNGGSVNGDYTGMAPQAKITSYSTTEYVYLPYVVAAWDHLLGRIRTEDGFQPDVVSNSYGVARGNPYNPNDPVNVASWKVYQEGVLPVFAYGNDGPNPNTSNRFAKAPHVLGVAAAQKTISSNEDDNRPIVGFSSRGREFDRDNTFYNREQLLRNLREFFEIQNGETATVKEQTFTGSVGPGANTGPVTGLVGVAVDQDTGSSYEDFTPVSNVDQVDLTLSLSPEGQWVRMRVYERQDDDSYEEIAQLREEVFKQHDTLTVDVDGGREYQIEMEPEDSVTTNYTIEYTSYSKPDGDLNDTRPITLYRPGISTHGDMVMSTQDKYDVLGPLGEFGAGEPFYGRLSGTSMACPAAAGIAMLVKQAYREQHLEDEELSPIDTIRIMEHAAANYHVDYTPHNTGAGFVDAQKAVTTAEDLATGNVDLETGSDALVNKDPVRTPPEIVNFSASGSRSTDSSVNQDQRAQEVTVTIDSFNTEATDSVEVYDEIPSSWDFLGEFSDQARIAEDEKQPDDGSRTKLRLIQDDGSETVSATDLENGPVTFTYFVETPDGGPQQSSGQYTLGPAEAVLKKWKDLGEDEKQGESDSATFGGTSTVLIAGTPL